MTQKRSQSSSKSPRKKGQTAKSWRVWPKIFQDGRHALRTRLGAGIAFFLSLFLVFLWLNHFDQQQSSHNFSYTETSDIGEEGDAASDQSIAQDSAEDIMREETAPAALPSDQAYQIRIDPKLTEEEKEPVKAIPRDPVGVRAMKPPSAYEERIQGPTSPVDMASTPSGPTMRYEEINLASNHQETSSKPKALHPDGWGRVVVVIDDMGGDYRRSQKVINLDSRLTLAFLPYVDRLQKLIDMAKASGATLMLHMPMEPMSASENPGPKALIVGVKQNILREFIDWQLTRFDGFVGVNNHMGSKFTTYLPGMRLVMQALKPRGLFFLDSKTTAESVARQVAKEAGIPFYTRDVFLDHVDEVGAVRKALHRLEEIAQSQGYAIAIGHPKDATIQALQEWIPTLADKKLRLVPIDEIKPQNANLAKH